MATLILFLALLTLLTWLTARLYDWLRYDAFDRDPAPPTPCPDPPQ